MTDTFLQGLHKYTRQLAICESKETGGEYFYFALVNIQQPGRRDGRKRSERRVSYCRVTCRVYTRHERFTATPLVWKKRAKKSKRSSVGCMFKFSYSRIYRRSVTAPFVPRQISYVSKFSPHFA